MEAEITHLYCEYIRMKRGLKEKTVGAKQCAKFAKDVSYF